MSEKEKEPFETYKPYHDTARDIETYVEQLGREAASGCRSLGWVALGGLSMTQQDSVAEKLEAISRNAESLADEVRELDDPREDKE